MRHWILQLRASPACRMTCRWAERLEDETRPLKYRYTNYMIRSGDVQCLNTRINQKPSEKMPGNENTKSGVLRGLFFVVFRTWIHELKTLQTVQTKPVLNATIRNLKAPDSLLVDSLIRKLLLIPIPTLSFCAEPKAEAQNPSSNITLVIRERGDRRRRWLRARQKHFFLPLIRPDGHLLPREKDILR